MRGTDQSYVFVTEDADSCEITVLLTRVTDGGLVSQADRLTLSILPSGEGDPRSRLREALISVIEHL